MRLAVTLLLPAVLLARGSSGQKRLSLKELDRVFRHGDQTHVIRMASFSTTALGRGERQFVAYVERGHLHGRLFQDSASLGGFDDDELLGNVRQSRIIDVDGDGRRDVLVVFTYQQPALGTEGLAAQVLLRRAGGRFEPAPAWASRVKRRLLKVPRDTLHTLSSEDVVEIFRETRHGR